MIPIEYKGQTYKGNLTNLVKFNVITPKIATETTVNNNQPLGTGKAKNGRNHSYSDKVYMATQKIRREHRKRIWGD